MALINDKLIEVIGGIEYWQVLGGYEARYKDTIICNTDLDRLKRDAAPTIDLLKQWLEQETKSS